MAKKNPAYDPEEIQEGGTASDSANDLPDAEKKPKNIQGESQEDEESESENPEEEATETPDEEESEESEEIDDDLKDICYTLLEAAEKEDWEIRLRLVKQWRQIEEYFQGIQDIYWDEAARDWRTINQADEGDGNSDHNQIVNILRAHGESITAALSVDTPNVVFTPDDADNPVDVSTAYGLTDVVDLIEKHNDAPLKQIQALILLCKQGTICGYNYYHSDPKYGTVQKPNYGEESVTHSHLFCPYCGHQMGTVKGKIKETQVKCPSCRQTVTPEVNEYEERISTIKGYDTTPKGRECIDLWGPMNVKLPLYARRQEDCGYLLLRFEQRKDMLADRFPEIADLISTGSVSGEDSLERNYRLSTNYLGTIPIHLSTVRCLWIRPWLYQALEDEDKIERMKKDYPNGTYLIVVDKEVAAVTDENLDDHWTISFDPLSTHIHGEPLLKPLIPVQDMRNDLVNLTMQTIEYGITENFADNTVLDFKKYKDQQAAPGMFTPAKAASGKSLSDGFYSTKPATLSQEVQKFGEQLDEDAQFLIGDFPSVYGGTTDKSGTTATEYTTSRSQALQRLGLTWKKFSYFWVKMLAKAAFEYVANMDESDHFARKTQNNTFENVWLIKEKLSGTIACVEPEGAEQLPLTWMQKRQVVEELFKLNSPEVNTVLFNPNNSDFMKRAFGANDITLPGEKDRLKQLTEIYELAKGKPLGDKPSIDVDPDVDDHAVHIQVIKAFMVDDKGQAMKRDNPAGYLNNILHLRSHQQVMAAATAGFHGMSQPGQAPESSTSTTAS